MGRKCDLETPGPGDREKWSLSQVAELLNYQDAESIRDLIREGRLPRPRGIGASQYYTPLDVAIIFEMFGRWLPAERPTKPAESPAKRGKSSESPPERESEP